MLPSLTIRDPAPWQGAVSALEPWQSSPVRVGTAIAACARASSWQPALKLLEAHADVISYSSTMNACQRGLKWVPALDLLMAMSQEQLLPDVFSFSSVRPDDWRRAISLCQTAQDKVGLNMISLSKLMSCGHWRLAHHLYSSMALFRAQADQQALGSLIHACRMAWAMALSLMPGNELAYNSVISACGEKSMWEAAVQLMVDMQSCTRVGLITENAVLTALARGRWPRGIQFFKEIGRPGILTYSAAMSACGAQWHYAVALLSMMPQRSLIPNEICYGACISACEKGRAWAAAVALLRELQRTRQRANDQVLNSVFTACEACDRLDVAPRRVDLWALARLEPRPEMILAAVKAVDTEAEVSKIWWSCAMLGIAPKFLERLPFSPEATSRQLLLTAWGAAQCATSPEVLIAVQREWSRRLEDLSSKEFAMSTWKALRDHVLGTLWACNHAQLVSSSFLISLKKAMSRGARLMDGRPGVSTEVPSQLCMVATETPNARAMGELTLIFKPSGWQVEDTSGPMSLHAVLVELVGCRPIFDDHEATRGFLHRLDVPSSGLILAASSYAAYYDLRIQLAHGKILREYLALCHGHKGDFHCSAPVYWRSGISAPSRCGRGRPSRSQGAQLRRGYFDASSASYLKVQIATGRRHQIRVHLAFMGHPIYHDAMYTSSSTHAEDRELCGQNMLHRHRLRFYAHGRRCDATAPPPTDMAELVLKLH